MGLLPSEAVRVCPSLHGKGDVPATEEASLSAYMVDYATDDDLPGVQCSLSYGTVPKTRYKLAAALRRQLSSSVSLVLSIVPDCSGCLRGRSRCHPMCYTYDCAKNASCHFVDQDAFCKDSPGQVCVMTEEKIIDLLEQPKANRTLVG